MFDQNNKSCIVCGAVEGASCIESTKGPHARVETREQWLASLKVGDLVAIPRRDWSLGETFDVDQITHITPSRNRFDLKRSKTRYNQYGREPKSYSNEIAPYTDRVKEVVKRFNLLYQTYYFPNKLFLDFSTEDLEAVSAIMKKYEKKDQ